MAAPHMAGVLALMLAVNPALTPTDIDRLLITLVLDQETFDTVAEAEATFAQNYAFTLPETPGGTYTIVAGTDRDDDGFICDIEDACGSFPDPVTVTPGEDRPGIEILVGELASPQSVKPTVSGVQGKKFRRLH